MKTETDSTEFRTLVLEPADNQRLTSLCGQLNQHLKQIEQRLDVQISLRGNTFTVSGSDIAMHAALVARSRCSS